MTYSRLVAILKVALPLLALGLLSTLFLVSHRITDSTASIPFAELDLAQRAREQQITAPFFSGRTNAGHLIAFSAESARPDPDDPARSSATKMDARIDFSDGSQITIASETAAIDNNTHTATLEGGVLIISSAGYDIQTSVMIAHMREGRLIAPEKVSGTGPGGTFEAGSMEVRSDDSGGETTLFFSDGVKLIYAPVD
ncbi:MAG: LPS export ABC transporter periplasmic protein LptC [Rhodobacteraceae bacterium]|nr:LPS export ABC transporter periplasmic protein LptC [Paracoccaceae bacterium]